MSNGTFISRLIYKMAKVNNHKKKSELKTVAKEYSLNDWKKLHRGKVGSVGFFTGLLGGPIGLVLETLDTGYLAAIIGRASFGVGHILGEKILYEKDIENILSIWCEASKPIAKDELKNSFKNHLRKNYEHSLNEEEIEIMFDKYISYLTIDNKVLMHNSTQTIDTYFETAIIGGAKIATKIGTKSAVKIGAKYGTKILAKKIAPKISIKMLTKASAKLSGKVAGKMSTKWIPIIGGLASGAINIWVINTIIESAHQYYKSDYIIIDESLLEDVFDDMKDI